MKFYHGTTDALKVRRLLLPPNYTKVLREGFRRKLHDTVFLTASLPSAERYVQKLWRNTADMP